MASIGANAIGWPEGDGKKDGGKKGGGKKGGGHSFDKLLGSDHAQFSFDFGGSTVLDFTLDYLHEDDSETGNASGYDSGLSTTYTGKYDGTKEPDLTGSVTAATSLDYNINNLGLAFDDASNEARNAEVDDEFELLHYNHGLPFPVPDLYMSSDGWVFDAIYEFRIDGSVFGNQAVLGAEGYLNGFSMTFESLHASPAKEGEFINITPPPPPPQDPPQDPPPVPEPATLTLLAIGLGGIVLRKKTIL